MHVETQPDLASCCSQPPVSQTCCFLLVLLSADSYQMSVVWQLWTVCCCLLTSDILWLLTVQERGWGGGNTKPPSYLVVDLCLQLHVGHHPTVSKFMWHIWVNMWREAASLWSVELRLSVSLPWPSRQPTGNVENLMSHGNDDEHRDGGLLAAEVERQC